MRARIVLLLAPVMALAFTTEAHATAYVVNSNADAPGCTADGALTFREAMVAANQNAACGDAPAGEASDIITFALAPGERVITLAADAPFVASNLTVDGGGVVELDGGTVWDGLRVISRVGVTLRGLVLRRFVTNAISIFCDPMSAGPCGGHTIAGNRIGTDASGMVASPNGWHGVVVQSADDVTIGGPALADRNIISGNTMGNVLVGYAGAERIVVKNNYIGVGADGVTAIPGNMNAVGISVYYGSAYTVIGGGEGEGNVVAGNPGGQISVSCNSPGSAVQDTLVEGNLIGVGADGATMVGGGTGTRPGVQIISIGNCPVRNTQIGSPGRGNVIGGQGGAGIELWGSVLEAFIQANHIGVDRVGNTAVPNQRGISTTSVGVDDVTIGGSAVSEQNVIAGNAGFGLYLSRATDIEIAGNLIGVGANGTTTIPNGGGIFMDRCVDCSAHDTRVVGSTGSGAEITMMSTARFEQCRFDGNGGAGVTSTGPGTTVDLMATTFVGNGALGIDVGATGVTANDAMDLDEVQNTPVITSAALSDEGSRVQGTLSSALSALFRIELYAVGVTADPSGHGEASEWLGSVMVTTAASGDTSFEITPTRALVPGETVTATATRLATASTSEHATNVVVADTRAGSMSDAGMPADGGVADDASTPDDASVAGDAGTADAGAGIDASAAEDASVGDAGVDVDASATADSGSHSPHVDGGGCACTAARSTSAPPLYLTVGLALLLATRMRRRAR